MAVPEAYGGPGADFFYNIILSEEAGYGIGASSLGIFMQSDIVAYYVLNYASDELKQRWIPKMVTGEAIVVGCTFQFRSASVPVKAPVAASPE